MRPLRLEAKGFTAFRDAVELDFTALDVFAIAGPTGSGKSSLLDAMTYALYGRVERVGDRVGQLVSQGQPRMAVTLEFEAGRDRYRVTRSTRRDRGPTKILLERRDGDGSWQQAGGGAGAGAGRGRRAGSPDPGAVGTGPGIRPRDRHVCAGGTRRGPGGGRGSGEPGRPGRPGCCRGS